MVNTAAIMVKLSSQPALVIAQPNAAETEEGEAIPQAMNATMMTAVVKKRTLSSPKRLRWSSTEMPGTSPGCRSWG